MITLHELYEELELLEAEQAAVMGLEAKENIQAEIDHCRKQIQMVRCPNCHD